MSGRPRGVEVLSGDLTFEDVLEVRREGVVDVVEVRHVDHVVDDLAAVGSLDDHGVPGPVGPFVAVRTLDTRNHDLFGRRIALGVVPDEELTVLLEGRPRAGTCERGHAAGIRNAGALSVAAPAPVVEGAGDGIALDLALCEVTTHVTAVSVENFDVALAVGEHHELRTESLDRVRFAVLEGLQ